MKETELMYYNQFADFLSRYEENSEKSMCSLGNKEAIRLVAGESQSHLKHKLQVLGGELQNPFIHIRNWVKGEMLNLGALISAISEKDSCDLRKQNAIKRLNKDRESIQNLSEGKFSFKYIFKSDAAKVKH